MTKVWRHPQTFPKSYQPMGLVREYLGGTGARVGMTEDGRYDLIVPASEHPFRVLRRLHDVLGRAVAWQLFELDESGRPTVAAGRAGETYARLSQSDYIKALRGELAPPVETPAVMSRETALDKRINREAAARAGAKVPTTNSQPDAGVRWLGGK